MHFKLNFFIKWLHKKVHWKKDWASARNELNWRNSTALNNRSSKIEEKKTLSLWKAAPQYPILECLWARNYKEMLSLITFNNVAFQRLNDKLSLFNVWTAIFKAIESLFLPPLWVAVSSSIVFSVYLWTYWLDRLLFTNVIKTWLQTLSSLSCT